MFVVQDASGPIAEAAVRNEPEREPTDEENGQNGMKKSKSGLHLRRLATKLAGSVGNALGDKDDKQKRHKEDLLKFYSEHHDNDHSKFAQLMAQRMEKVGLSFPSIEVRWKNVTVEAQIPKKEDKIPNIANTFSDGCKGILNKFVPMNLLDTRSFLVVNNARGVLKPGRMCLLLGPPGSGRSTLMKALFGQIVKNKELTMTGNVTYNGKHPHRDFVVESTASYFDQRDSHIAEMTVDETISFASECLGTNFSEELHKIVREREVAAGIEVAQELDDIWRSTFNGPKSIMVDIIELILGIDHVKDTVVGDDLLKGISGGQKRRVTSAEMAVGMHQVLFMDEISTGLDSATTFSIMSSFQNLCCYMNATLMATLLQPSPQVFELFDDVMLMSQGRIVFQGPREDIVPFFNSMNLFCPLAMSVPDFLQEVTNALDQEKFYKAPAENPTAYRYRTPRQIQKVYHLTEAFKTVEAELESPHSSHPLQHLVLHKEKYAISYWKMFKASFKREALLLRRGYVFLLAGCIQTLVVAFFVSTSFVRHDKRGFEDANAFLAVNFFSLMVMLLGGFNNIPFYCKRLPIFYKQKDYNFYNAWVYAVNSSVLRIPEFLINGTAWSIMVYFSVGFAMERSRFFIFWLNMVLACALGTTQTQAIGAVMRSEVVTQGLGGIMLLVLVNTSGYSIARESIRGWWIWVYWINPLSYCLTSLSVNELLSNDWSRPALELSSTDPIGLFTLKYRSFFHEQRWVWIGIGTQCGFIVLLIVIQALVLQYLPSPVGSFNPIVPPEDNADDDEKDEKARSGGGCMTVVVAPNARSASLKAQATAITFNPLSMSFTDVCYYVQKPGVKEKCELQLLDKVSGCFRPGVLTALMGASGAGKTTLMDVLASRKSGGRVEGDQRVNGFPKDMKTFARVMGYVEQCDVHMPQTTVKEALLFSARMRLPGSVDRQVIDKYCMEVMSVIELDLLPNNLVGMPGNGLSTEQRKRLTIGVELVSNPSIVFMDEPTSGLDGRAAALVMRAVRNTVSAGRTVVCTIHQPSKEIVSAFDELLLLKAGGRTIFFGPLGDNYSNLVSYFESFPVERFNPDDNPANWMLEVTNGQSEKTLDLDFADEWLKSTRCQTGLALVAECDIPVEGGAAKLAFDSAYPRTFLEQLVLLLERYFICYWRNPQYNLLRFAATFIIGIVFGTLFWGKGNKPGTMLGLMNMLGALFATTLFMGLTNVLVILPVVYADRVVYYRERASGMYGFLPYALAQGFVEQPYLLVQSIFYVIIVYFTVHFFFTATKFFWFFLFFWMNLMTFTSFGIAVMNLAPAIQLAMASTAPFVLLWNLYCGFLIYKKDIHGWWIWAYYLNPATYTIYGCVVTQLGDLTDVFIDNGSASVSVAQYVKDNYSYEYSWRGWIVLILVGYTLFFRAVACFGLYYFRFQVR